MQEMIKLENVTKVYKTGVRAVNDMSLTIDAGEFVYVIGPTGAGKTTIVKLLMRFYDVNKGAILVDGHNIQEVKLLLMEPMYLVLRTLKSHILDAGLELYSRTIVFYQKRQSLKMSLLR